MTQGYPQQSPQFPILLSTMNDLPGYKVVRVFGEVFGLTVRSRNMFSTMGAGFKAMAGGELKGLSKLLSDSRYEALGRLAQEAMNHGANAVLALRFDCNEIAQTASEIAAYGTAVYVMPDGAEHAQQAAPQQQAAPAQQYQQPTPQQYQQQAYPQQ
ncbi:YbjQ family protein [Amycolatopsis alkalitolerans]|uniref:YbjQ family protein n=1 Tax=Amycolatopsis alkalitolerans TaxID=2547244 RepID=UPI001F2F17C7|nr:YbjQ family protein [Amycolatopsis alkalitolerans]